MSSLIRFIQPIRLVQNYQHQFLRLLSSTAAETTNATNNREKGVVKRFSREKGYGFISKQSDGTDCFVHFKNINLSGFKALEQGQEVEFTVVQGDKGVEARDVDILSVNKGRQSFFDNSSKPGFGRRSRTSSSAFNFGGTKSTTYHSQNDDSTFADRTFDFNKGVSDSSRENLFSSEENDDVSTNQQQPQIGSVKRWSAERGFGFIRRMNGGPDVFCHVRSLKDGVESLEEGQTVQYRLRRTDKGEEARDVSIFKDENSPFQSTDPNERYTGTVKRWIEEKSYGFIHPTKGGFDVFVHRQNLPEGVTSLTEGQTVQFNIKSSGRGQTADNITVENQS